MILPGCAWSLVRLENFASMVNRLPQSHMGGRVVNAKRRGKFVNFSGRHALNRMRSVQKRSREVFRATVPVRA